MIVLRVPYPMGFYAKGFDGRIDDPKAGWKGRGLWAANGDRTALADRGRQGYQAARRALPAAAGPAREVGLCKLEAVSYQLSAVSCSQLM